MSNVRKYREAGGSLVRLLMCTRPDLSYVVTKLSQYLSESTIEQRTTATLKGTKAKLLCYRKSDNGLTLGLDAFDDANWAEHETYCTYAPYFKKVNHFGFLLHDCY